MRVDQTRIQLVRTVAEQQNLCPSTQQVNGEQQESFRRLGIAGAILFRQVTFCRPMATDKTDHTNGTT